MTNGSKVIYAKLCNFWTTLYILVHCKKYLLGSVYIAIFGCWTSQLSAKYGSVGGVC